MSASKNILATSAVVLAISLLAACGQKPEGAGGPPGGGMPPA